MTEEIPKKTRTSGAPRSVVLSQTARYALRLVSELAAVGGGPLRAVDLEQRVAVPPHYVAKVLRRLVRADLLRSQKGKGGGYELSRPAAQISVRQVLAAVDALPTDECIFGWATCQAETPCPLHHFWRQAHQAFFAWAADATFAEQPPASHRTGRLKT